MQKNNIPIETISLCNTIGDIRPIRIRLEDDDHQLIVVNVDEVLYCKECNLAGMKSYRYGCKVKLHGKERIIELMYNIHSHKWTIVKILN